MAEPQVMPKHRSSTALSRSTESLSERAYQLIRDKILRGQYPLGAALSRRQLAKELRMIFCRFPRRSSISR